MRDSFVSENLTIQTISWHKNEEGNVNQKKP